jgi:LPXTG-motif cell wall-anchored protein
MLLLTAHTTASPAALVLILIIIGLFVFVTRRKKR